MQNVFQKLWRPEDINMQWTSKILESQCYKITKIQRCRRDSKDQKKERYKDTKKQRLEEARRNEYYFSIQLDCTEIETKVMAQEHSFYI